MRRRATTSDIVARSPWVRCQVRPPAPAKFLQTLSRLRFGAKACRAKAVPPNLTGAGNVAGPRPYLVTTLDECGRPEDDEECEAMNSLRPGSRARLSSSCSVSIS